ncbi:hypothetical protein HDU97_007835 [Phlyctochytrium planicorne]|nr:hypothetical protein HDU97_007835 [Phlyctochytrium planicorne]
MQVFLNLEESEPNGPNDATAGFEKTILVELQGTLETGPVAGAGSAAVKDQGLQMLAGKELGRLTKDGEKYFLTIGRHRLVGKKVKLKNPIAMVQKAPTPPSASANASPSRHRSNISSQSTNFPSTMASTLDSQFTIPEDMSDMMDIDNDSAKWKGSLKELMAKNWDSEKIGEQERIEMRVVSIVEWKYVFDSRPQNILSEINRGLTSLKREKRE